MGCGCGGRASGTATGRPAAKPAGELFEVVNGDGHIVLRTRDQNAAKARAGRVEGGRYRKAGTTMWLT